MQGTIFVYTGEGRGKSSAAIGRAIQAAEEKRNVVMIQFMKGSGADSELLRRLEPEIKFFRFERSDENYNELSEQRKHDEVINIKNGLNFAKKVLATGGCDLLILDEVLGLVEQSIISADDLKNLVEGRGESDVILTGIKLPEDILGLADEVSRIETVKCR